MSGGEKDHPQKRTILIVEDEQDLARVLQIILEGEGYRVVLAADGGQALEMVKGSHPDLVLLDLMLPILDGRQVCRAIREGSVSPRVPIILMTAAELDLDKEKAQWDAFLQKPFEFNEVLAAIEGLLKG